jgi:CBS domain-containing protein
MHDCVGSEHAIEFEDKLSAALQKMSEKQLNKLLVMRDGELLGVIEFSEIKRNLGKE